MNNAKAVTISPLNFELNGNPGDTVSNLVRVYNDLDVGIGVAMETQDFVSAGEQGQVLIKGHEESGTYSLANWVSLSPQTFSLAPHSSQTVEFTVKIPAGGEPGGHYASVLATVSGEAPGGGVGINQKVGALLLLSVAGEISENLGLVDFNPDSGFTEYGPEKLIARFKNEGTVHLKPRGFVIIKNVLGNEVVKMDLPQLNVLPQSARTVDIPLKIEGQFGRYEATLAAIYGATNEPLSAITVYWVIPYKLLAVYGGVLLVLLILAYRGRKRVGLALRILFKGEQKSS
ncbi:MAG: hypothetical protein HYR95_02170 [Candidatus Colwellbacteria bacterium]|nr:hypothetical protein [Candidatus Colwellbacteria bacterium]